ncbi:MAG: diaminopimelate epimerase [Candidatus Omnitrophica bacterium]|nr:diaminopimelate epimerase [Candidatus Omnitrophota bacterium]
MKSVNFTKMVASGNDFVIIAFLRYNTFLLKNIAKKICDRKRGVGADGLLFLEKSKIADIRMRIFNPDGSEAEMCGNGVRCAAFYYCYYIADPKPYIIKIETKAGVIESNVNRNNVRIKLTEPKRIKPDFSIKMGNRLLKVNFIDTGVPHTVIFVEGLEKIDIFNLGRKIRYHKSFSPHGTNVDFVEILDESSIKIRTYERGVEEETLSCGTGAVASALFTALRISFSMSNKINVYTRSGEILKVYFKRVNDKFKDVYLEGKVRIVYKGVYYV